MKAIASEHYGKDIEFEPKLSIPVSKLKEYTAKHKAVFMVQKDFVHSWVEQHGAKTVYRGMRGKIVAEMKKQIAEGKTEIEINANTLSSWSDSHNKAKNSFGKGGVVLSMKVKPENVWACYGAQPFSSFKSHQSEREYVMGMPEKIWKIKKEDLEFL